MLSVKIWVVFWIPQPKKVKFQKFNVFLLCHTIIKGNINSEAEKEKKSQKAFDIDEWVGRGTFTSVITDVIAIF